MMVYIGFKKNINIITSNKAKIMTDKTLDHINQGSIFFLSAGVDSCRNGSKHTWKIQMFHVDFLKKSMGMFTQKNISKLRLLKTFHFQHVGFPPHSSCRGSSLMAGNTGNPVFNASFGAFVLPMFRHKVTVV